MDTSIQRLYYSITDVSKIIAEEQHVLRYWEREFSQLKPVKNRAGNRVYTKKDLDVLRTIKRLLRDERYTVAGAKEHLRSYGTADSGIVYQESDSLESASEHVEALAPKSVDLNSVKQIVYDLRELSKGLRDKIALAS